MRAITKRIMYSSPSPGDSPVEEKLRRLRKIKGMRAITRRRMYSSPSPSDSLVEEEIEKAEENEGDEGHHQEENVVPHLVIVR